MNRQRLAECGGKILRNGILQIRDPNDNARHRYQYAVINGVPSRRVLPDRGDYDPPSQWEPLSATEIAQSHGVDSPIVQYFLEVISRL